MEGVAESGDIDKDIGDGGCRPPEYPTAFVQKNVVGEELACAGGVRPEEEILGEMARVMPLEEGKDNVDELIEEPLDS